MKKILRFIAILVVSIALAWLGWAISGHQSSAAFELACAVWFFAAFHWLWWPKVDKNTN